MEVRKYHVWDTAGEQVVGGWGQVMVGIPWDDQIDGWDTPVEYKVATTWRQWLEG